MIDILGRSELPKLYEEHLYLKTVDNQIGFIISFNQSVKLDLEYNGAVLIDSPWNIAFYSQDANWKSDYSLGNGVKSLWSGTCILPINKGLLYDKPATLLTREECIEEIIHQFIKCGDFQTMFQKCNNGLVFKRDLVYYATIYEDWKWNGQQLESQNKKWVNTYFNEKYRPSCTTELSNMYIGGAHCQTSMNIWTMESAVESGKIMTNTILQKYTMEPVYQYVHKQNWIIDYISRVDNVLYEYHLPNILQMALMLLIIVLVFHYLV